MHTYHPSSRHAPSQGVTAGTRPEMQQDQPLRRDTTYTLAHGDNTARFTELDMDSRRMHGTSFSVKKTIHSGRYMYYTYTYIHIFVCVLFTDK